MPERGSKQPQFTLCFVVILLPLFTRTRSVASPLRLLPPYVFRAGYVGKAPVIKDVYRLVSMAPPEIQVEAREHSRKASESFRHRQASIAAG
jgi:hypothetical protein